ncbi:MAG: SIS domain-containing protein [Firmicutes bacterium]|nr:SIS domain-containing protein [Bacillota bacterium]
MNQNERMPGAKTRREISAQPEVWRQVLEGAALDAGRLRRVFAAGDGEETLFIGCGTSYYLALAAASGFRLLTGRAARALPASEILLYPQAALESSRPYLAVLFSRSGETTEAVRAAEALGARGDVRTVAITCSPGTPLPGACAEAFVLRGVTEDSVVMTQSFTSMLLYAQYAAATAAGRTEVLADLERLPGTGRAAVEQGRALAETTVAAGRPDTVFFLGGGPCYGLACEGMLKVKEMAIQNSEAYHPLEFRHGPKALISPDSLVVYLATEEGRDLELPVALELAGLGARVLAVTERPLPGLPPQAQLVLESGLAQPACGALYLPFLQWLGFFLAQAKGLDPDRPVHLSAVTRLDPPA